MVPVIEYMDVPRIERVPRVIMEEVEEVIRVPVVREVPVTRMVEIPTGKYVKILFYFHSLSFSPLSFISCHCIVLSFFSFRTIYFFGLTAGYSTCILWASHRDPKVHLLLPNIWNRDRCTTFVRTAIYTLPSEPVWHLLYTRVMFSESRQLCQILMISPVQTSQRYIKDIDRIGTNLTFHEIGTDC